jgi:hypothetical protein
MRSAARFVLILLSLSVLASCGGGGGGGGSSSPAASAPSAPVVATTDNFATIAVGTGVTGYYGNILTTTVTVCIPGTESCSTVPNVQVDTGSTGLRLVASALDANANVAGFSESLAPVPISGVAEAECAQFADGVVWGSVKTATVTVGGLTTTHSTAVQVIGDASVGATPPTACSNIGTPEQTPSALGANGIIGVGYFQQDCGPTCAATDQYNFYFACASATSCSPVVAPLTSQLTNTVAAFASPYNNGDVIELPAIPATGQTTVSGHIVFGVSSAPNNQLSGAPPIGVDPDYGTFNVYFNGTSLSQSFIDSGSSVYFFTDTSIAQCTGTYAGYYCPASPFYGSGTITGVAPYANSFNFDFSIVSAMDGVYQTAYAFNDLGAPPSAAAQAAVGSGFDIGLPYFFGHSVFTAFNGASVDGVGAGPFAAVGGS